MKYSYDTVFKTHFGGSVGIVILRLSCELKDTGNESLFWELGFSMWGKGSTDVRSMSLCKNHEWSWNFN